MAGNGCLCWGKASKEAFTLKYDAAPLAWYRR
jgi:hypothetical protein